MKAQRNLLSLVILSTIVAVVLLWQWAVTVQEIDALYREGSFRFGISVKIGEEE